MMNMTPIDFAQSAAIVMLHIAMLVLALRLRSARQDVSMLADQLAELNGMLPSIAPDAISAHARDQATIDEWIAERAKCAPGSPKHTAYTNRLREVGAL